MTARESAVLRDLIVRAELHAKGQLKPKPNGKRDRLWAVEKRAWRAKRFKWCVYCGARIRDKRGRAERGMTCSEHSELLRLDPVYNPTEWSQA